MNSTLAENQAKMRSKSMSLDGDASCAILRSIKLENRKYRRTVDKCTQTERSRKFRWSGKILRSFRKRKTSQEVS